MKVIELFAGVGGFRLGLKRASSSFEIVWGNQYEPATKQQHAFEVYKKQFTTGIHSNEDIAAVQLDSIPDHDLLVGGFPCQDYSVARSLHNEKGIEGKKGVLFWEIMRIVEGKQPRYILLENVDRLLKSPSKQRGRDFSIMLKALDSAGYSVQWRVINAADYGFAQRRRRIFIFAAKDPVFSFFDPIFPAVKGEEKSFQLPEDLLDLSDNFSAEYESSGSMTGGIVTTAKIEPVQQPPVTLKQILHFARTLRGGAAADKYNLSEERIEKFKYMKGAKRIERTAANGHKYIFSEGGMAFPDPLDKPARTMLTSEATTNRSTHIVEDLDTGKLRTLTPEEAELINDFPAGWTEQLPDARRFFCMGNALVVGLIEKMGKRIIEMSQP